MSGYATNTDIMHALDALRREVQARHENHERRLSDLERMQPRIERLTEHVADIGAKVGVLVERAEGQERLVGAALRLSGAELVRQVTDMVRAEMSGMRDDLGAIKTRLDERPCLVGEGCTIHGGVTT